MGAGEGLRDFYYGIEDKWYGFVDAVSEKIPAFGSFIDGLEEKGIPSFPAFIILVIIILAILAYVFLAAAQSTLTVAVFADDGSAVASATVAVLADGVSVAVQDTGTDGTVAFLLPNGQYSLKIDKTNYASATDSITLSADVRKELTLVPQKVTTTKPVFLKTSDGSLVSGTGTIIYSCRGSSDTQSATYLNGKFDAQVPENCPEVVVTDVQNYRVVNASASFSGNSAVTVERPELLVGKVNVTLSISGQSGASTVIPAGLRVKLVPNDGTSPVEQVSMGTPLILFESVPIKSYYIMIIDNTGSFESYDGSKTGDIKAVAKDQTTEFNAALVKAQPAKITVTVRNILDKSLINGAEVRLSSTANSNEEQSKITGATGTVEFNVAAGSGYIVMATQPEYVVSETKQAVAGDTVELLLTKADPAKANSILVKVTDPKGMAVENARVILKKVDATEPVVGEKTTGSAGEAEFFNLELGKSYSAVISKEGYGSVPSQSVQVDAGAQKVLQVTFDVGEGSVLLKVISPDKTPLNGASVKQVDYFTSQTIGEAAMTSEDGIAQFTIRADRKVYFLIESTGYQKYYTAPLQPSANASISKEVELARPSGKLEAKIVGVYSGGVAVQSQASDADKVGAGVYEIKAVISVPKGTFSEAGMHLRTGKETPNVTNLREEDSLYLSSVNAFGKITRGTTYTPPMGNETDTKPANLTQGDAKWANIVWRNPQEASYEVEAEVTVSETDSGVPLNLFYRGWAKGGTVLRDPVQSQPITELYSDAKNRVLIAGTGGTCAGSFCKTYMIETTSGSEKGKKRYVSGTFDAKKGIDYTLTADLTNYSDKAISGASLSVSGKGLDIKSVTVNGAVQNTTTVIPLGTIGVDAPLNISVAFNTTASGNSGVKLTINSSVKTELDETIAVNVKANKKFEFNVVPKIIIPYITNTMFFEAVDGNSPLDGVVVSIKSGRDLLGTVETDGEGLAKFELSDPRVGDKLAINAMKEGYDSVDVAQSVDGALLTITPPSVEQTIKIGEVKAISTQVILQNNTQKNIKIDSVVINGDIKSYFTVKFQETLANAIIEQGKDRNFNLDITLTSEGKRLTQPKDLTGTVIFNTSIIGGDQSLVTEWPINLRISMPGYLDNAKCLQITPATLDFSASDGEQSKSITIKNSCAAEGYSVPMRELSAKLSEAAKIGKVSISSKNFAGVELTEEYAKIADSIDGEAEDEYTVRFVPSVTVPSGVQNFTVAVMAKNIMNDNASEKVESTFKLNATTAALSKCVEIVKPEGGIVIDVAPWNLGYGRLMGSSTMSPYMGGYGGFSNYSSPYNMQYSGGMGMSGYGTSGYGMSGYGAGYNGYNNMMAYGGNGFQMNSFKVKNNCSVDVEVSIDPDSRLTVSEQKFNLEKDNENVITVEPGYMLGKYKVKVSAKITGSSDSKKEISSMNVTLRRLGDNDSDCISTNVSHISLDSFVYRPQTYSVYNKCYDRGWALARSKVASIECSAPKSYVPGATSTNYFQYGMEPSYGMGYPLGGQYTAYNNYIQSNGCAADDCSVIMGTRVRYRTVEQSGNNSIERVDFDVMPSAQYIPQRKLFDNTTMQYGLFQKVSDFRSWMTDTDARTNIYGNLNISYTNEYGVSECMTVPITLSDTFRIGESLDSALNWGDPNAKPRDCQNEKALDIVTYWKNRYRGSGYGEIPDDSQVWTNGKNGNVYIYAAEPPALEIGPAPIANNYSAYPMNNYNFYSNPNYSNYSLTQFNNMQRQGKVDNKGTASKNCGAVDSIEVKTKIDPKTVGGAYINIVDRSQGSVLVNTYGSNLWVEIDRSNMTADCVVLTNYPIIAKVSRTISWTSQELTWPLSVIFTRPGYKYDGHPEKCMRASTDKAADCLSAFKEALAKSGLKDKADSAVTDADIIKEIGKLNTARPDCVGSFGTTSGRNILNELRNITQAVNPSATGDTACSATGGKPSEYGFNNIKLTGLNIVTDATNLDCSTTFCNNTMMKVFLANRMDAIQGKVKNLSTARYAWNAPANKEKEETRSLVKLYDLAGLISVPLATKKREQIYYMNADKTLAMGKYTVPEDIKKEAADKKTINFDITKDAPDASVPDAASILGKIMTKEGDKVLLEITATDATKNLLKILHASEELGSTNKVRYLSLSMYKAVLDGVAGNLDKCKTNATACEIKLKIEGRNEETISVEPTALMTISKVAVLVRAVPAVENMDENSIETVYAYNGPLGEIHQLAKFSTRMNGITLADGSTKPMVSKDMLMAKVADTSAEVQQELFRNNIISKELLDKFAIKFKSKAANTAYDKSTDLKTVEVGSYEMEMDYNYFTWNVTEKDGKKTGNLAEDNNVTTYFGERKNPSDAPKVQSNALLASGFNAVEEKQNIYTSQRGLIVGYENGTSAKLYKMAPIKMKAELKAGVSEFVYRISGLPSVVPASLVMWYNDNGQTRAADNGSNGQYSTRVTQMSDAQTIRGIFYAPDGVSMVFPQIVYGGNVYIKTVGLKDNTEQSTPIPVSPGSVGSIKVAESGTKAMDLTTVLDQVSKGNACPIDNKIIWNETKFAAGN